MRDARSAVATFVIANVLALACARVAEARETTAVDDEKEGPGEGGPAPAELDNDAIELEALGPRSNLRTRAEEVSFDARLRTLELAGNVRVDSPPFHLRSQRIKLTRTRYGIEIVGKGSLAFCPCLGTPLTVDFDEALVAPPGDLILTRPTLRLYDVPILPLPYFWLRSDEKLGVLPPDLAYRGDDGLYVGGGVHLPWKYEGTKNALDLRGGAYLLRGFVADARLRTPTSTTRVRYDRLPGGTGTTPGDASTDDGLSIDARGATSKGELGVSWDADVLRGARGVVSTTDLDAAARRWDRVTAEGALRGGPVVVSTAMRAVTRRGTSLGDVEAAGPITTVRASGALGSAITYDATLEGGALRVSGASAGFVPIGVAPGAVRSPDTLSFVRAEVGARAVGSVGAVEGSLAVRGAGDVAQQSHDQGDDRAASVRGRVAVPLARRFGGSGSGSEGGSGSGGEGGEWVHGIEPFGEIAVLHDRGDRLLELSPARGGAAIDGTAPVGDVGITTTLGRWASREAIELGGAAGGAGGSLAAGVRPLARGRASASTSWLGVTADVARVFGEPPRATNAARARGLATVARLRVGAVDGLRVLGNVAHREGIDPVLARVLVDAPLEPASGFLVTEGTTGGAGLVIPWSSYVTTSVGADGDASKKTFELVAARAGVELRDRCGCLTLRVIGSHRLAREGVDVWLALDFASNR